MSDLRVYNPAADRSIYDALMRLQPGQGLVFQATNSQGAMRKAIERAKNGASNSGLVLRSLTLVAALDLPVDESPNVVVKAPADAIAIWCSNWQPVPDFERYPRAVIHEPLPRDRDPPDDMDFRTGGRPTTAAREWLRSLPADGTVYEMPDTKGMAERDFLKLVQSLRQGAVLEGVATNTTFSITKPRGSRTVAAMRAPGRF